MKLRARLTLWYAGILFLGLLLIAGWAYYEVFVEDHSPSFKMAVEMRGETVLDELAEVFLFGILPAFALAIVGGWFLMKRALSPITALTEAMANVQPERLHYRLQPSGTGDELDRLTQVFNAMTERLERAFEQVREFTLHASHEIKTPLTVMRGELEEAMQRSGMSESERDRFGSLIEEVDRLNKIVDSLTFLARADAGLLKLESSIFRLDELVKEAAADAKILAQPRNISVQLDRCDDIEITGDRRRLRQLLLILTDNAVKYNHDRGVITVSLTGAFPQARLTIANSGPGIPKSALDRIFERFYRVDPSHSNEVEGSGLGLSIARSIVRAHGGSIELSSEPGKQTVSNIILPNAARVRTRPIEIPA